MTLNEALYEHCMSIVSNRDSHSHQSPFPILTISDPDYFLGARISSRKYGVDT